MRCGWSSNNRSFLPFPLINIVCLSNSICCQVRDTRSLKAYSLIKEILLQAKKKIQIIDPYFDKTIYHLIGELDADIQVQLITERVMGDAGIVYSKMKKERKKIEVKVSKKNHDRFIIIDEKTVFLLGGSINSIGDKASMIIPIDLQAIKQEIKNHFKEQWGQADELK